VTARVLIVDDTETIRLLLRTRLANAYYHVIEAANGEDAIRLASTENPDLVLLDVMLPGIDGFEVCRRLKELPATAHIPVVIVTALDNRDDRVLGLEIGADDFLSKPFDELELAARIRSLLRTKALQDRLADLLGRYVSENIAAEALRDPYAVALGGERRHATMLFADLRGYTTLAAEQPPEATLDLLNRYLTEVSDAIEEEGGTVADLLGDGVFAFFGAPSMHADDPARSVRAALAIQTAVSGLEIPSMPGVRLQTGIGITTGEVIAGNIGSERRMHYGVVGDPVNVAGRLQAAAGPGQILIDGATHGGIARLFRTQDLGSLRLAGKGDWVQAYNVVAPA
jgi:adenylate cyclase